jgi:hypothetical protein
MSKIVDFRNNIIAGIKAMFPEMDVDWYDGLFDEHDIADWTLKTPCARVAILNVPQNDQTVTREMNACLRVVVVIIDENKSVALDGDARAWEYVEKTAIWANLNKFGTPDAAPAFQVKFKRISQPVLRREGVSVGVIEWQSDLMIGTNHAYESIQIYNGAQHVTTVPRSNHYRTEVDILGVPRNETVDFTVDPED